MTYVPEAARELGIGAGSGEVPALLRVPGRAKWLYILGHGAGAGMRHPFMEAVARRLADRDVATLRYEFPYMAAGGRRPDPAPRLIRCVRDIATFAAAEYPQLRIAAGGKSMGGRMTSLAQAEAPLPRVERLFFLGFPLHRRGTPDTSRAAHLPRVGVPMLFLQGTRDALADSTLMTDVCAGLGAPARLHFVEGADHGFEVLMRSGRTAADVLDELTGQLLNGWP